MGIEKKCEMEMHLTFYLSICRYSVDRHTDMDRIFNIDSGNGSIFTSKPLDREMLLWHNITVIAAEISKLSVKTHKHIHAKAALL